MPLRFATALLALTPPLVAQSTVNTSFAQGSATVTSVVGRHAAFTTSESAHGADLNGDGVLDDAVIVVHDLISGSTRNTGLALQSGALPGYGLGERQIVSVVPELSAGPAGTDMNGDGDVLDRVYWEYDLVLGTSRNLGFTALPTVSVPTFATSGDVTAFIAPETADWTGDGDATDTVVVVARAGAAPRVLRKHALSDLRALALGAQRLMFLSPENAVPPVDLNGDGDSLDQVAFSVDFATWTITSLGVGARDVRADGDVFVVMADEPQSGADLDGDGDALDVVPLVYQGASTTPLALGYPVSQSGAGSRPNLALAGRVIAWSTRESSIGGGIDLDLDGDVEDLVLCVHHVDTATTTATGIAVDVNAGGRGFSIAGDRVGCLSRELFTGVDQNGDGDATDGVAHVVDARTGIVTNLGLAAIVSTIDVQLSRSHAVFTVREAEQGGTDLDGNGSVGDGVVAVVPLAGGAPSFPPGFAFAIARDHVVLTSSESSATPPVDLNGDGDTTDNVVQALSLASGSVTNLGLALASLPVPVHASLAPAGVLVRVSEFAQGTGPLNGDGDTNDGVAYGVRL